MAVPFGKYKLLKKLAAGGMGQVFLARSAGVQGFEKLVVIKRILPHLVEDEEFLNMFFDEARLAARLNHPNVIQIFELGEEKGSHYLAMEFVSGEDLRRLDKYARAAERPLPLGVICRIIADAAAGLDYAHKARDGQGRPLHVVHRDVSPQNILVGVDGAVKLIDFGVARAAGRMQVTSTGILKGKYPYMSPEQVDALEIDHRSDIFALGIVFWEMVTGKRLFKGDNDIATMKLVRACEVAAPSTVNPQLPRALDPVVMRALKREPAERYQDANDLRMAIDAFAMATQLPASTSHLVTCMRELFPDHDTQNDASLDELGTGAELDQAPAAKGTPASSSKTRSRYVAADQEAKPRGVPWLALTLGVLVLGGGGFAVLKLTKAPPPVPVAVQAPAQPPVTPPTPPSKPADVTVHVTSKPAGAEIFEGSAQLGTTPADLRLSRQQVHALTFKAKGYTTADRSLDLSRLGADSTQLDVELEKVARKHASSEFQTFE